MKARITLIASPSIEENPLSPDYPGIGPKKRRHFHYDIDVSCLQEAREYYDQAVVLDFPSVRGLLLRSIEEVSA